LTKKIAIIGGGVIGCLTAIKLKESGFEVVVVDKYEIGKESSWAGAGILFPLMPWDYEEKVYDLCKSASFFYKDFSKKLYDSTGVDPEYKETGMILIPPYQKDIISKWANSKNFLFQEIFFKGSKSILFPKVSQIRSPRLMKAIKLFMQEMNIEIIENMELDKIANKKEVLAKWPTKKNSFIEADYFVLTSGAWSPSLRDAYKSKIHPVRGQMIQYKASNLKIQNILYSNDFYILQRKDGVIIAGSSIEEVGFDETVTNEWKEMLMAKAEQLIPELKNILVENHWAGFRPGAKENIPFIQKDDYYENIFINAGHFRYGLTMAPQSAENLKEILLKSII
jgi:glycine oxidase|tara:strand:+ start:424 stop:1437 length:1014 start_codon:yes stop_codon:yes gene_type:complete